VSIFVANDLVQKKLLGGDPDTNIFVYLCASEVTQVRLCSICTQVQKVVNHCMACVHKWLMQTGSLKSAHSSLFYAAPNI